MNNPIDDNIPSIKPDLDQVEAYKNIKKPSQSKTSSTTHEVEEITPPPAKKSGLAIFNSLVIYSLIGAASYWFYQQHLLTSAELTAAELRIVELEKQLSATDEEMGESTVAMRAKLEGLIEKTDKLWAEMDKLWASAWRRNQSEIKTLRSKNTKTDSNVKALKNSLANNENKVKELNEKQTALTFNLDALTEQLNEAQTLKAQIDKLAVSMNTLETKSSERDSKQIEVASMIQALDTQVKLLIEQFDRINVNKPANTTP